ncbi:MAG: HAD-IIA family hydrolase [Cyclobacteriaceae bacterium]|nr:HAD-IIA family hydrolase [Cyclobacteriaceae bacterium SS2]
MKIKSFESVVKKYKTIFFDAYGVLKNHKGLIPGINQTFQFLAENNIDYFILTNDASRSPSELADYYQKAGLHEVTEFKLISSGMLAREYLRLKVKSGTIAYLGTDKSAHYIEALGLKTISIQKLDLSKIDDITAVVFLDDEGFDWNHDINKVLNLLRRRTIPAIVCNTDKSYPVSKEEVAIAIGGISKMVEEIVDKKFIRFGKPDAQMFVYAYEHALNNGQLVDKGDILMVGDTLATDILGGNKFGLDTALVLTGNTLPDRASFYIQATGIIPNYVCESAVIQ